MLNNVGQYQVILYQLDFTFWRWDRTVPVELGATVATGALTLCKGMALDNCWQ